MEEETKKTAALPNCNIFTKEQKTEYFNKLEKWLIEAYVWHSFVTTFPYITASSPILNGSSPVTPQISFPLTSANVENVNEGANLGGLHQRRVTEPAQQATQFQPTGVTGIVYKVPPIWKRFVAELIDSLLLLVLKMSITYIAVDVFDFIDIEKYYLDMLQTNLRIDYKMALELTSGILVLELIHRIFVCLFEASWLQRGRNGHIGGATPGKSIMKLKVVQCHNVTVINRPDAELILVIPGRDLGLLPALGRSVLKNLVVAFFFPIVFAYCFFKFNRTFYDLLCNSIVVEDTFQSNNHNHNNNNYNNINNNFNDNNNNINNNNNNNNNLFNNNINN